jgi:hypothetical protein
MHLVICDIFKKPKMEEIYEKVKQWVKESRTKNGQIIFKRHGIQKKLTMVFMILLIFINDKISVSPDQME